MIWKVDRDGGIEVAYEDLGKHCHRASTLYKVLVQLRSRLNLDPKRPGDVESVNGRWELALVATATSYSLGFALGGIQSLILCDSIGLLLKTRSLQTDDRSIKIE